MRTLLNSDRVSRWRRWLGENRIAAGPVGGQPGDCPARGAAEAIQQPPRLGAGRRVLLAEDEPVSRMLTALQLRKLGCQVQLATNGREALARSAATAFDLVLMDCQMPEVDGYEATRRLRQREGNSSHVPVIALTAHALAGDRDRCLDAGMDDYLAKPCSEADLRRILAQWLSPAAGLPGARPPSGA